MVHTPRHTAEPAEFTERRQDWTDRYQEIHSGTRTGDWATPRANRILKKHLYSMAHGKCVFCESALDVTAVLEIEHLPSQDTPPNPSIRVGQPSALLQHLQRFQRRRSSRRGADQA